MEATGREWPKSSAKKNFKPRTTRTGRLFRQLSEEKRGAAFEGVVEKIEGVDK
jgi:hypothetical protein